MAFSGGCVSVFKVFFSWQSDLPSSDAKDFVRQCIDDAIEIIGETEAFEAERDEATMGLTGSPNIVESLYSKIESCDLFIADISTCYRGIDRKTRMSPNPNVLVELGFAASCIGWDRIICLCNKDYGDDYPFDISHNRITTFSLRCGNRDSESKRIMKIVARTISDLKKQRPKRTKGQAFHVIGSYDSNERIVRKNLSAMDLNSNSIYDKKTYSMINFSKKLIEDIRSIILDNSGLSDRQLQYSLSNINQYYDFGLNIKADNVSISDVEEIKRLAKLYLNVELHDDFFYIGNLKKASPSFFCKDVFLGTDQEKEKNRLLSVFIIALNLIDIRNKYKKTFDGCILIPLAIHNDSVVHDKDIRVVIHLVSGEPVNVDGSFICKELEGKQGIICQHNDDEPSIMEDLLCLSEDGTIHFDDCDVDLQENMPSLLSSFSFYGSDRSFEKDQIDYSDSLNDLVSSPEGKDYYEFYINDLRPNESKWLGRPLLLKPAFGEVKIRYEIISSKTTGTISDELELSLG